jgi:glycosidase
VYGSYELLMEDDEQLYVFTRILNNETLLVICNFSKEELEFQLPTQFENNKAELLISNYPDDRKELLRPYEAKVYKLEQ